MDKKAYSLKEVLDRSRITRLSFPYEPAPEELDEFHRLVMNMDMRTCDGKPLDAYLKELSEVVHTPYNNDDSTRSTTFILDSTGALTYIRNTNKGT